jgi:hypothetical protein
MSAPKKPARVFRPTRRQLLGIGVLVGVWLGIGLYANRDEFHGFVYRQVRGTSFEQPFLKWHLTDHRDSVVRSLANDEIQAGDSVESFLSKHGPHTVQPLGRYTRLTDVSDGGAAFEGRFLIAKDGRLAAAGWWTCTGKVRFFDKLTPEEWVEVDRLYREYRDQQDAARRAAQMAVAGFAALDDPWNLAPTDPQEGRVPDE